MRTAHTTLGLVCLLVSGCGGGNDNPVAPSPTVPSVQGTWQGLQVQLGCSESPDVGNLACGAAPSQGPLSLTLFPSQGSALTGTLTLGNVVVPVTGSVNDSGQVSLAGQAVFTEATVTLLGWTSTVSGNNMVGTFDYSFELASGGQLLTVTFHAGLQEVVRS